jgi:hypothetical protein
LQNPSYLKAMACDGLILLLPTEKGKKQKKELETAQASRLIPVRERWEISSPLQYKSLISALWGADSTCFGVFASFRGL